MSLDFLRHLAFEGELQDFIRRDPYGWTERSTGVSLAFDEGFLRTVSLGLPHWQGPAAASNQFERFDFAAALTTALDHLWSDDWRKDGSPWSRRWRPGWLDEVDRRQSVNVLVDVASADNPLLYEGPRDYEGFPIRYRVMGPIEAQLSEGDPVQAGGRVGTLTGLLQDTASGDDYALMSGHVAGAVGTAVSAAGAPVGAVSDLEIPSGAGPCNLHAAPGAQAVDAALVRLSPTPALQLGAARSVQPIAAITAGDLVEFSGVASGRSHPGVVMNATIWKPMDLHRAGATVCCGDIFEISHRRAPYVSKALSKSRDSGAAVVRPGASTEEWFGVLMGGQRSSSFVCYAEHVMAWALRSNPNLVLRP
ncbi:MAG: hypothetical protein P4L73_08810 [Caulobacteraceae bacterium]|nr:hypothetical protein [Caulobacteraceae bacterium]